jgi:hypothetical protein
LLGGHRQFHPAMMEIPHGIGRVPLREDRAVRAVFQSGFPAGDSSEECRPIDRLSLPISCSQRGFAFAAGRDNIGLGLVSGLDNLPLGLSPELRQTVKPGYPF